MPGLLSRLFSPRWRHPDPTVRREAVTRLDATRQREVLEQLAQDEDPDVRLTAVQRLDDPDQLLRLRQQGVVSRELDHQLAELLCGRTGGIELGRRLALVEEISDPALRARIAMHGDNQQLRLTALAGIDDETMLIEQACDNSIAAVRHAAAERVTSEQGLKQLVQTARRDRHVQRNARDRLSHLRADADAIKESMAQRESLLIKLEQHGRAQWEPLYAGRFRHLEREWLSLADQTETEQERRFQEACLRCRKVINDHEAHEQAQQADQQRREQADLDREALVMAFEESLDALRQGEHITQQDLASLRSQKQLLATRWQTLSETHLANPTLRQRYDTALKAYDVINQAWLRLEEHGNALEEAFKSNDEHRLKSIIKACAWPGDLPLEPRLARVQHYLRLERELTGKDNAAEQVERFDKELAMLEQLLDDGAFKAASRLHQRLKHLSENLPSSADQQLASLKRHGARLAELRDWRGFVAGPKREQLCQAIEALEQEDQLTDQDRDRRHRQLVKQWKALGDAAANREQSERFRSASDRIRATLETWHDQQRHLRQSNLAERVALCDQLEALLEQPAALADPDALRDIRDKAREQWRRTSPVPRDDAEAIGRRFGRIRHRLQALIDRRATEIAEAKRALIGATRQLLEQDMPSRQRAERVKALQHQWRELGRAPKGEEQTLWREFRQLCDDIFAQRDAERNDRTQRLRQRQDEMQALIDRVDAWQPTSSSDAAQLDQILAEANALEPLPSGRRTEGMRRRWTGIIRARRERIERIAIADKVSQWRDVMPLIQAHLKADADCLAGRPCHDVPLTEGMTLSDNLHKAHQQRNDARRNPVPEPQVAEQLARLRVHLALMAGHPIAHHDEPLRLAIQVDRLNDNFGQPLEREDELEAVLCALLATGPVSPQTWQREVNDLDTVLDSLTQLPPP